MKSSVGAAGENLKRARIQNINKGLAGIGIEKKMLKFYINSKTILLLRISRLAYT